MADTDGLSKELAAAVESCQQKITFCCQSTSAYSILTESISKLAELMTALDPEGVNFGQKGFWGGLFSVSAEDYWKLYDKLLPSLNAVMNDIEESTGTLKNDISTLEFENKRFGEILSRFKEAITAEKTDPADSVMYHQQYMIGLQNRTMLENLIAEHAGMLKKAKYAVSISKNALTTAIVFARTAYSRSLNGADEITMFPSVTADAAKLGNDFKEAMAALGSK
ncbi:MAG: hypothetical protein ACI4JJ_02180 [Huintestinicola sp.]